MGSRMVARLLETGHDVVVFNRSAGPTAALVERGARAATTPREAARDARVVLSMVRDDAASHSVWLEEETGAMGGIQPGAVAIESSTLSVPWVQRLGQAASAHGVAFVDAPVVGTRPHAAAGRLVHLVGGEPAAIARAQPILEVLGEATHNVGSVGHATAVKLAVNTMFAQQVAALAEMLAALETQGIPTALAVDVLSVMPTTSPVAKVAMDLIAGDNFDPLFPVDLVAKDLGYMIDAARGRAPIAAATHDVFTRATNRGWGGDNIVAVAKLYRP